MSDPKPVNVYKREARPIFEPLMCEHRHDALDLTYDQDGRWRGIYCRHCRTYWQMSDLGKALQLYERALLDAPD